jgi:cobyrinic acid a,c-diamide synthase
LSGSLPAFVVAGTHSGVGKTTVTVGLIGALRARGLRVAPFKAGPDYIDPTYHTAAAGHPSRNLDTWLMPRDAIRRSFDRGRTRSDVVVVEGVMGLFDGKEGERDDGSTASLAKLLGLPVVLVVDARAMSGSAAALVHGYASFDADVDVCGVILNNLGSDHHYELARDAIERHTGVPVFGGILRSDGLVLPERHLGLIPEPERAAASVIGEAARIVAQRVNLDALLARTQIDRKPEPPHQAPSVGDRIPVAIARDEAFSFYYEDGLDALAEAGAELLSFSPLRDRHLPAGARGLYIGGGFPEVFAAGLAQNRPMLDAIQSFGQSGAPVFAECGGHMYLGESLTDQQGVTHPMVGLTPVRSTLAGTRLTLGYRTATSLRDGPLGPAGTVIRAHEFHLSTSTPPADDDACWRVEGSPVTSGGFARGGTWSSYLHLHFGAQPELARSFVGACAAETPARTGRRA